MPYLPACLHLPATTYLPTIVNLLIPDIGDGDDVHYHIASHTSQFYHSYYSGGWVDGCWWLFAYSCLQHALPHPRTGKGTFRWFLLLDIR